MNAKVADVMTENVMALRAGAPFKEIAARLSEQRVTAFPVLGDDGTVIGIVSEADLMPKEALEAGYDRHTGLSGLLHRGELGKARGVTAADLMSSPAITIRPFDFVSYAAHIMYERRIRCLPVVDRDGRLAGMISRADVLKVFSRPDDDVRREITEKVILWEFLDNPPAFDVTVADGIVTIAGALENAELGRRIVDDVRRLEGVVAVRDRLTYPRDHATAAAS